MKQLKSTSVDIASPDQLTFAEVLKAVEAAPDLTQGVRSNMRNAVTRCVALVGSQGPNAVVDVHMIARRLEVSTPAKLGLATPGSMASFQSNLRRALRLAGVNVMPGRHRNPLSPAWAALAASATSHGDGFIWPPLSRFVHHLSQQGIAPNEVDANAFAQFGIALKNTCLNSKAEKVIRKTAKAWEKARAAIPGWPDAALKLVQRKSDVPLLPWSAFPKPFHDDALKFLDRDDDWLSVDSVLAEDMRRPLRPKTKVNYLNALRRIASIRVSLGTDPSHIRQLRDLVPPDQVRAVLRYVSNRTGRTQGGHVMFLALLLFMVARDHAGVVGKDLTALETYFKKTRTTRIGMSERTLDRYNQFEQPKLLEALLQLPSRWMTMADKAEVNISSAKLARLALYLRLLLETCARSGNVVGLDLETHVVEHGSGKSAGMFLVIPAHEVKNGQEIRVALSPHTVAMLKHYRDHYRQLHCSKPSTWLFPIQDGSHWNTTRACTDLKDMVARHLGADVTPHLMRSLAGKIVLDAQPGAIGIVQQLLGHKQLATTISFYVHLKPKKARDEYQTMLSTREGRE